MAARPRMNVAEVLRLACWNTDGVRGRKLELEHFLRQHGVDVSLDRNSSARETSFGLQTMFVTEQTGPQREAEQQYWSVGV
jgi:hypothetical protein